MRSRNSSGFALVITLMLLALLVLAVFALSALTKVGNEIASAGAYQVQARQNALLGFSAALGRLQESAGEDEVLTGTADIVPTAHAANSRWTGVWPGLGGSPRWLVSGEVDPASYEPGVSFSGNGSERKAVVTDAGDVVLVNSGSTNMAATKYQNGDAVVVRKVPVPTVTVAGSPGMMGRFAFWIGDEGVKLSAALPGLNPPGPPAPAVHNVAGLPFDSWTPDPGKVPSALSYEQLVHAGDETATSVRTGLRSNFHGLTLLHAGFVGTGPNPPLRHGLININSAGTRLWRGIVATYQPGKSPGAKEAFADAMGDRARIWAPASPDKLANGPFRTVAGFLDYNPDVEIAIVDVSADLLGFKDALRPWLAVRSDTFRIRAYGESVNPVDPMKVESTAFCEAIVQRTTAALPGFGRRFVVVSFRWLGPDDI
jgi:hypothetical protein